MGTVLKASLVFFAIVFCILFTLIVTVINVNNTCILLEASIVAQYSQNQNNYDNFFKKVKEVAKVSDKYSASFKELYDNVMKGRYGENGSVATFQWLQENNPTLDPSIYKQIQQVIESGRNDFEYNQKMLIDKKRNYQVYIQQFPNSFIAGFLGFPKIDLKQFDIVTSETTEVAFATKKTEPLEF